MFSRRVLLTGLVLSLAGCGRSEIVQSSRGRFALADLLGDTSGSFVRAVAPKDFEFPQDHGSHPSFRSEWWYLTANLTDPGGARYGVQFTIFRQAMGDVMSGASRWRARSAWMTHVALTDVSAQMHRSRQALARGGALGLAGAITGQGGVRVWVEDQRLSIMPKVDQAIRGAELRKAWVSYSRMSQSPGRRVWVSCSSPGVDFSVDLVASTDHAPVPNGDRGLSQKGPEPGNASYYYSMPHLDVVGVLTRDGRDVEVTGHAWLDREWSTSVLSAEHVGWDWFALRLSSGPALMVYRLRRRDGQPSRFDYGAWYPLSGGSFPVGVRAMTPLRWWRSEDGARWPVAWQLELEDGTVLRVSALVDDQLMRHSIRYWEGAVNVTGSDGGGDAVDGEGYMEMTGYGIND